jgi:hypothetical protein
MNNGIEAYIKTGNLMKFAKLYVELRFQINIPYDKQFEEVKND